MTIEELSEKVEKGRAWLAEHDADPPGRFYLWWMSKVTAFPAQPKEVVDRYYEWKRAFDLWLRLYAQLESESDALQAGT